MICGSSRTIGSRLPHVERADALRAVNLVGGEAHQVDAERADVDGDLANGLRGVAVQENAARFADGRDFGERLNDADFVVGEHHRDEARVVANGVGHFLRIEPTGARAVVLFDIEQCHVVAAARESRERIEHGLVFGRDADQMIAASPLALGHAADGEVVAFGRAAGEDDFRWRRRRWRRRSIVALRRRRRELRVRRRGRYAGCRTSQSK